MLVRAEKPLVQGMGQEAAFQAGQEDGHRGGCVDSCGQDRVLWVSSSTHHCPRPQTMLGEEKDHLGRLRAGYKANHSTRGFPFLLPSTVFYVYG
jgi:hypothetical protein